MALPLRRTARRTGARGLLAAVALGAPAALGAQQVELRLEHTAGDSTSYRSTVTTTVTGSGFFQTQSISTVTRQTVISVAGDGTAVVRVRTVSIKLFLDGPLGRVEYDSESGELPNGPLAMIAEAVAARVGESYEMRVSPDGRTERLGGASEPPEDLTLGSMYPAAPVAPGAEWASSGSLTMPTSGLKLTSDQRYTLRSVALEGESRIARIDVVGTATFESDTTAVGAAPLMIDPGPTTVQITGEIRFDVDRGLVTRSFQRHLTTLSMMGQSFDSQTESLTELIVP